MKWNVKCYARYPTPRANTSRLVYQISVTTLIQCILQDQGRTGSFSQGSSGVVSATLQATRY